MRVFYLILFFCLIIHSVSGQTYQGLSAAKFVNAIDSDTVTLDHKNSGPLVMVIFTSNYCPYSRRYEDRINDLYQEYSQREVEMVLVNPNNGPDDSLEEMKKKAEEKSYQFPYLKDPDKLLTQILGATRTPEAFLLKPIENGFELVYRGAIDDNPQASNDVENHYLKSAIEIALQGQAVEVEKVKVTGCIIKK